MILAGLAMGQCWSARFRSRLKSLQPALPKRPFAERSSIPSSFLGIAILLALATIALPQTSNLSETSHLQREAEEADASGDVSRAISLYAASLSKHPEWTEGWWKYGGLLYDSRRFPEAAQAFGRLTRLSPENPLGFALLGLCEYEEQNWDNSIVHLERALAFRQGLTAPISRAATFHLGLALMREDRQSDALRVFKRLFYSDSKHPGLIEALGAAELNLHVVPEPHSPLEPAVNLAGDAAAAVFEDRKKDAEKYYQTLLSQFPNQTFVHLEYGTLLEREHRDDDATAQFQAETKLNPSSSVAWMWLGRIALDEGHTTEAREYARRARSLDVNDSISYLIEGRSYMLEHEWENSLGPLREAEKKAPQSSEIHYALITVYSALKHSDEARRERQLFLETAEEEKKQ